MGPRIRSTRSTHDQVSARENFGCGSSRDHAPSALLDFGLRSVAAPGFVDIFYNNCTKNGVLRAELSQTEVDTLTEDATNAADPVLAANLPEQTIGPPNGTTIRFEIDAARKTRLLEGLDDIGQTLKHLNKIQAYEERLQNEHPWL